jgi:hypothetical protein
MMRITSQLALRKVPGGVELVRLFNRQQAAEFQREASKRLPFVSLGQVVYAARCWEAYRASGGTGTLNTFTDQLVIL